MRRTDSAAVRAAAADPTASTELLGIPLTTVEGNKRMGSDMQAMRASGIEVNGVGYRENEGTVVVGMTRITPDLERLFLERHGGPLRLDEQPPSVPL